MYSILTLVMHLIALLLYLVLYYLDLMSTASTAFIPPYPNAPSRAPTLPPSTPEPKENDSASDTAPAAYVLPIKKKRKKVSVYTQLNEEVWELEDAVIVGESAASNLPS